MGLWHLSDSTLVEYADADIEPRQQAVVAAHLARCRRCAGRLDRIRGVASACQGVEDVSAPTKLRHLAALALRARGSVEISCHRATPLLQESMDGSLSPFAAVALQQHLNGCAICRAELAALASAARAVRSLPLVDSPAAVRARVAVASRRATRPAWVPAGWRLATAGVAAALVIGAFSLLRPTAQPQPHWQPVAALDASEGASVDARALEVAGAGPGEGPLSGRTEAPAPAEIGAATAEEGVVAPAIAPAARATVRLVSTSPKGPSPAPVSPTVPEPRVTMPTAFTALRAVKAASDEAAVRRALELAGERFATLRSEELSEATLVQLPATVEHGLAGTDVGPSVEQPEWMESEGRPAETDEGRGEPSENLSREGASLLSGPFV